MSPLALETSPQPETTAPESATIGLGIPLAEHYLLHDNTNTTTHDPQHQHQPTFLYPDPSNPSWYTPTTASGEAAARGWHHSRTHSLPASLAQFTFSFPSPSSHHHHQHQHQNHQNHQNHHPQHHHHQEHQQQQQPTSATTTIATSADLDTALVDPSIIGGAAAAGLSVGDGAAVSESWADWVDLDGPASAAGEGQQVQVQPQALGVVV
jgi:hypothetical protein